MEQKPGWTYKFIDSLGMYIAVNDKTDILYTEDKTMYTREESILLRKVDYEFPIQVHIVKKLFEGTIVNVN